MPTRTLAVRRQQAKALTIVLALACGTTVALTMPPHAHAQPASVAPGAPSADAVPTQEQITARMDRAEERINRGADDGSLTHGEAHRVLEQLANIKTQTNELVTRDGALTPTDAQFINDRLNTLSHEIHWAKNNDVYRW